MDNVMIDEQIQAIVKQLLAEPAPTCPYFSARIQKIASELAALAAQLNPPPPIAV